MVNGTLASSLEQALPHNLVLVKHVTNSPWFRPAFVLSFSPRIVDLPMLTRKQQCKTTSVSAPTNRVRELDPGLYVKVTAVTVLAAPNMRGHKHTYNLLLPRPFSSQIALWTHTEWVGNFSRMCHHCMAVVPQAPCVCLTLNRVIPSVGCLRAAGNSDAGCTMSLTCSHYPLTARSRLYQTCPRVW